MKTITISAIALSALFIASPVPAQERQVTVYSGPIGIEMPASALRGSDSKASTDSEVAPTRKIRVVLQSPYGK